MFDIEEIDQIMREIIQANDLNVVNETLSLTDSIVLYTAYKHLLSKLYLRLHEREEEPIV